MAKPKGLKASSKAAAFVPPPASPPPPSAGGASSLSDAVTAGEKRTFPTDGDALTIDDIFELKQSAQALLAPGATVEQEDEARGLLRGILHGCDALVRIAVQPEEGAAEGDSTSEQDRAEKWLRQEASARFEETDGADPVDASSELAKQRTSLGLMEWYAPAHIAYLQAFALHELGNHLLPPQSAAQARVEGAKRRKVDPREPTTAEAWLDEALVKYAIATKFWSDPEVEEVPAHWAFEQIAPRADESRARTERAALHFLNGEGEKGCNMMFRGSDDDEEEQPGSIVECWKWAFESLQRWTDDPDFAIEAEEILERLDASGDPAPLLLRSIAAGLALVDRFPDALDDSQQQELYDALQPLLEDENVYHVWTPEDVDDAEDRKKAAVIEDAKRDLQVALLRADVSLGLFIRQEEAVEAQYRPDAGDDDEEDEDAEVVPLPDEQDVREAKAAGQLAIEQLKASIALLEASDSKDKVADTRQAQFQKLEEAYLVFSALINPDESAAAAANEAELQKIKSELGEDAE